MTVTATLSKGLFIATLCFLTNCVAETPQKSKESSPESPSRAADGASKTAKAKNIILFIGDGMGISTITAARIFDGQAKGLDGESHSLSFESFENVSLIKTYNVDAQVPDSAGTATAIISGYKTNIGAVNVRPNTDNWKMVFESCIRKSSPDTLTDIAKAHDMSVGIISTTRLTHATPAAMYGHSVSRNWESDNEVNKSAAKVGCTGLSTQLVNSELDLALGGGLSKFTSEQIATWTAKPGHVYVKDVAEFRVADKNTNILGLFTPSHLSYEADRDDEKEPSLAEMTGFAIDALQNRGSGYILMVEAGRVDHAHHATNAYRALTDMQALNVAVETALTKTNPEETLILVTADHSHVFTMAGYPVRGNPILGLVRGLDYTTRQPEPDPSLAKDNKPYTTLSYHNGPNVRTPDSAPLTDADVLEKDFKQHAAVPMTSETHGGEDVPLYATGPGAHRVRGVMEQDEIHDVMMMALGIKRNRD